MTTDEASKKAMTGARALEFLAEAPEKNFVKNSRQVFKMYRDDTIGMWDGSGWESGFNIIGAFLRCTFWRCEDPYKLELSTYDAERGELIMDGASKSEMNLLRFIEKHYVRKDEREK